MHQIPPSVLPPPMSLRAIVSHVAALGPARVPLEDLRDLLGYVGARFAPFAAELAAREDVCPICLEDAPDRVRLPCFPDGGHWVCLRCLRALWLRGDARCPTCRRDHAGRGTTVGSLLVGTLATEWVVRRRSLRDLATSLPGRKLLLYDTLPRARARALFAEARHLRKATGRDLAGFDHVVVWSTDRDGVARLYRSLEKGGAQTWSFFGGGAAPPHTPPDTPPDTLV